MNFIVCRLIVLRVSSGDTLSAVQVNNRLTINLLYIYFCRFYFRQRSRYKADLTVRVPWSRWSSSIVLELLRHPNVHEDGRVGSVHTSPAPVVYRVPETEGALLKWLTASFYKVLCPCLVLLVWFVWCGLPVFTGVVCLKKLRLVSNLWPHNVSPENIVFIVEMGVLIISLTIEATGRDVNIN